MPGLKIVAVTACVSGVAHTYMAAEQLEKQCQKKGYRVKVETQGALGVENPLKDEEITAADVAVIVADINIEGMDRFKDCRLVKLSIQKCLTNPGKILAAIEKARTLAPASVVELS